MNKIGELKHRLVVASNFYVESKGKEKEKWMEEIGKITLELLEKGISQEEISKFLGNGGKK